MIYNTARAIYNISVYFGRFDYKLKTTKLNQDVQFLQTCVEYFLFPKFLSIKLAVRRLQNSRLQREFQRKVLFNELAFKKSPLRKSQQILKQQLNVFCNSVSFFSFYKCKLWLDKHNNKYSDQIRIRYARKLIDLGFNDVKHPSSDNVIFKFSNRVLNNVERSVIGTQVFT